MDVDSKGFIYLGNAVRLGPFANTIPKTGKLVAEIPHIMERQPGDGGGGGGPAAPAPRHPARAATVRAEHFRAPAPKPPNAAARSPRSAPSTHPRRR